MDKALSESDIKAQIASKAPKWKHVDGTIRRTWETASFKATLMAVNAVGHLAELAWHHPEIVANFGSVEVRLSTHDAKGITDKDFALAQKIDALLDWRPKADGGPLEGPGPNEKGAAYFKS